MTKKTSNFSHFGFAFVSAFVLAAWFCFANFHGFWSRRTFFGTGTNHFPSTSCFLTSNYFSWFSCTRWFSSFRWPFFFLGHFRFAPNRFRSWLTFSWFCSWFSFRCIATLGDRLAFHSFCWSRSLFRSRSLAFGCCCFFTWCWFSTLSSFTSCLRCSLWWIFFVWKNVLIFFYINISHFLDYSNTVFLGLLLKMNWN